MKFSIGQMAKMFDITPDTLRYYDKIDLLKPYIQKENKYRYYSYNHIDLLSLILWAKQIGISLSDIKTIIESEDLDKYKTLLEKQQELINIKIKELKAMKGYIIETKEILNKIEKYNNIYDFTNVNFTEDEYTFYGFNLDKLLKTNNYIEYIKSIKNKNYGINEEEYFLLYKISEDKKVKCYDDLVFFRERKDNKSPIKKYLLDKVFTTKNIKTKTARIDFWGNEDELEKYLLKIYDYFNEFGMDNDIFVKYEFLMPKKNKNDYYFVSIMINLKQREEF